jgi:hypothetical protein
MERPLLAHSGHSSQARRADCAEVVLAIVESYDACGRPLLALSGLSLRHGAVTDRVLVVARPKDEAATLPAREG